MNNPIIASNGLLFLNVPTAHDLVEEVVSGDCYEVDTIPQNCRVLDLGACYGEFSILAAKRGFVVKAVEPSLYSKHIFEANLRLNRNPDVRLFHGSVVATPMFKVSHFYNPNHPAGSSRSAPDGEALLESVPAQTINQLTTGWDHWAIKMDVEGDERELFKFPNWLSITDWLAMEFHDGDGNEYAKALLDKGFSVRLHGCGPKRTRVQWDPSMKGGILLAKRSNLSIDG